MALYDWGIFVLQAFGALGGLYSTVADLAIWVSGFMDAWPARDSDGSGEYAD